MRVLNFGKREGGEKGGLEDALGVISVHPTSSLGSVSQWIRWWRTIQRREDEGSVLEPLPIPLPRK